MNEPRLINGENTGYYYETNNINDSNNLYDCLSASKNNNDPKIGDYLLYFYKDVNDNNNNIINLYKYIRDEYSGGFEIINYENNYIYIYTDLDDNIKYKNISDNDVIDFENSLENITFTGVSGNIGPNYSYGNIGDYYLKTDIGYLYYRINIGWIRLITCYSVNYYISNNNVDINDRFIIYTNLDEIEPFTKQIIYSEQEHQGYQGYYSDIIINSTDENIPTTIINKIKTLKLGRSSIIGDSLLCQYKDNENNINYKISVVINITSGNENVNIITLPNEFLFYELNTLSIMYINNITLSTYLYYFDQDNKIIYTFIGRQGIPRPKDNDIKIDKLNNNILTFIGGNWITTYQLLYKLNIINTYYDNYFNLESFVDYENLQISCVNKYSYGREYQKYQGYYNKDRELTKKDDLAVLEIIQSYKNDYVNIRDCLLIKINGIINTCLVLLEEDNLIDYKVVDDQTFFFNVVDDKVNSQFINNGSIDKLDGFEIDVDDYELNILDNRVVDGVNDGTLLLNFDKLYQYINDISYLVNINNRCVTLKNSSNKCKYYTDINGNTEVVYNKTKYDIFNGYYSGSNINDNNYYDILTNIKYNLMNYDDVKIGDYLLLSQYNGENIISIKVLKYVNDDYDDKNEGFTEIVINGGFYYYSRNYDSGNENVVLFIKNNEINVQDIDDDIIFYGFSGLKGDNPQEGEYNEYYYLKNNGELYSCFKNDNGDIEYYPIITGLNKFAFNYYIDNGETPILSHTFSNNLMTEQKLDPFQQIFYERYIVYIQPSQLTPDNPIHIKFAENLYSTYQGYTVYNYIYNNCVDDDYLFSDVSSSIYNLLKRDIIVGDTILARSINDNVLKIYTVISENHNDKAINVFELSDEYI